MKLVPVLFRILAVIHLLPGLAGLMLKNITRLYGVAPTEKVQILLLRRPAMLLFPVSATFAAAAHMRSECWPLLIGCVVSIVGVLSECIVHDQFGGLLHNTFGIDALDLPVAALIAHLMTGV